jgi:DNA polymerase elongation subunit (family B)
MTIVDKYKECVCRVYIAVHPTVSRDKVMRILTDLMGKTFKDIPCQMHNDIKHERIETTMTNVLEWIDTRQPIVAGSGAFFKQHEEYLAPAGVMLQQLMEDRSTVKNSMWKFDKHSSEYINLNTQQLSIKVIMNADYGASGTVLSPFFSPYIPPATTGTAKNLTTTLICCLEMASSNKHKYAKMNSINELWDMIFNVLDDTEDRELISDIYSVEEVRDELVSRTNNLSMADVNLLEQFLRTLSVQQLTKLMLSYNVHLVLRKYLTNEVHIVMSYLKNHKLDLSMLTGEKIRAANKNEDLMKELKASMTSAGFGKKPPVEINEEIERIKKVVLDNCIYSFILNDAEVRAANMVRQVVCVTDTDSLMVHFPSYIDDFQARGDCSFKESCLFACALGIRLFIEGIIPKFVSYIALGMGIKDKYYRDKFIFKNEYGFLSMALFAKKMYASSMFVQEGAPRDIHDIAVSGMSFKKRDAAEFLEDVMLEIFDKWILTSDKIYVEQILDRYFELKRELKRSVNKETKYYQVLGVKAEEAYKEGKKLPDAVTGSKMWNCLFPDESIVPMDRVIIVPLSFDKLEMYACQSPNADKILQYSLIDNENKKNDPVLCLPEYYDEIPDWLQPLIDINKLVDKLLSPFKQVLELFDVVMPETKGGCTASRMMCV